MKITNKYDLAIAVIWSVTMIGMFLGFASSPDWTEVKPWLLGSGVAGGGQLLVRKFLGGSNEG